MLQHEAVMFAFLECLVWFFALSAPDDRFLVWHFDIRTSIHFIDLSSIEISIWGFQWTRKIWTRRYEKEDMNFSVLLLFGFKPSGSTPRLTGWSKPWWTFCTSLFFRERCLKLTNQLFSWRFRWCYSPSVICSEIWFCCNAGSYCICWGRAVCCLFACPLLLLNAVGIIVIQNISKPNLINFLSSNK